MIKSIITILFHILMLAFLVYSIALSYVLIRFGKSKLLSLILAAFFLFIMFNLYLAAWANFDHLPFSDISINLNV